MDRALTPELMRQAVFPQVGETVLDLMPASDLLTEAECTAETACWQEADGMWLCSPCLFRFRVPPDVSPSTEERVAEHIRRHIATRRPMLIAFYCLRHYEVERPAVGL